MKCYVIFSSYITRTQNLYYYRLYRYNRACRVMRKVLLSYNIIRIKCASKLSFGVPSNISYLCSIQRFCCDIYHGSVRNVVVDVPLFAIKIWIYLTAIEFPSF